MASTGLLSGVNPYKGGNVAIDFVSKPLDYLMKDLAHQEAKAEAIEKYYKDKEKTLNKGGLTKEEREIFTKKLQDYKDFSIKNKNQIYYPKYNGYDKQSEADAMLNDLSSYLDEAKQNMGYRKALQDFTAQQIAQGKDVSDNYNEIFTNAWKPTGGGFVKPDITQLRFTDKYDTKKHMNDIWEGIKLPTKEEDIYEVVKRNGRDVRTGKTIRQTSTYLDDNTANQIANNAIIALEKPQIRRMENNLYQDKRLVAAANENFKKYFKRDIASLEDFAVGRGIGMKTVGITETKAPVDPNKTFNEQVRLLNYKKHMDDMAIKGDYSDFLTGLNSKSTGKTVIYNPATKKNEQWNVLPLGEDIRKDFTVKTKIVKVNSNGDVTSATYKNMPAQEILVKPNGDIVAHNNVLDENGEVISQSFDEVQIDPKTLITKMINSNKDIKLENKPLAIKTAADNWYGSVAEKNGGLYFGGKIYSKKQLEGAAKASGVTVEEYKKSILNK